MNLVLEGLGHRFGNGRWGLQDLNLSWTEDAFVLLTGGNGSGKSLLIRHLVGLSRPTAGRLLWRGTDLSGRWRDLSRDIGLVFQEPEHQILSLTVEEEMLLGLEGPDRRERAQAALAEVGLAGRDRELCAVLSGGEKRRLCLATTLVRQPELVILDEPFNGLDWAGVDLLLRRLQALRARGTSVLLVTHDLDKCLALADRVWILDAGRLAADGSPEALWDQFAGYGLHVPPGARSPRELSWLRQVTA